MHLTQVSIENIRCIRSLRWRMRAGKGAGWHVILGENGAGKTTFLRCVALALIGTLEADRLLPLGWEWRWLRSGARRGEITAALDRDEDFDPLEGLPEASNPVRITLERREAEKLGRNGEPREDVYQSKTGWFSAAYGPFRRFTGGDPDYERRSVEYPRFRRHLSLFEERVSLTDSIAWFKELHHQQLEEEKELQGSNGSRRREGEAGAVLRRLIGLINQPGFLPHGTRLHEVSSRGVRFEDGHGSDVQMEELSDGYRSILSLTLDLLRRLSEAFGSRMFSEGGTTIAPSGVVLIDEIDAHLHPTWQREIGVWFKRYFPRIQFLVTTHSPLVCQTADSVFLLPRPGTEESGRKLKRTELNRLRYGNVLDAYGTGVFGQGVTRSEASKRKLRRLAELNRKEIEGGLSAEEQEEQVKLRAVMPTAAPLLNGTGSEGVL